MYILRTRHIIHIARDTILCERYSITEYVIIKTRPAKFSTTLEYRRRRIFLAIDLTHLRPGGIDADMNKRSPSCEKVRQVLALFDNLQENKGRT